MQRWLLLGLIPAAIWLLGCKTPKGANGHFDGSPFLSENFSKTTELPGDWLALNGQVTVTNHVLQLPAEPLEAHGIMFGPAFADGLRVAAKFRGEKKGRRSPTPTFGVGLNGMRYLLRVDPAKGKLELRRNDAMVHAVGFKWQPNRWTHLVLQVRELPGLQWALEGKAWSEGETAPKDWTLTWKDAGEPLAGRPSVWGTPFSGQPIAVDDVRVWRID